LPVSPTEKRAPFTVEFRIFFPPTSHASLRVSLALVQPREPPSFFRLRNLSLLMFSCKEVLKNLSSSPSAPLSFRRRGALEPPPFSQDYLFFPLRRLGEELPQKTYRSMAGCKPAPPIGSVFFLCRGGHSLQTKTSSRGGDTGSPLFSLLPERGSLIHASFFHQECFSRAD